MKIEIEVPDEFVLAGLNNEAGAWRAYLRERIALPRVGLLQGAVAPTAQRAIDAAAGSLRSRLQSYKADNPYDIVIDL